MMRPRVTTGSAVAADAVTEFGRVLGSAVQLGGAGQESVTYDVEGAYEVDMTDPENPRIVREDGSGERVPDADAFGQLGAVCRPLPPSAGEHAVVVCLRTADGLVPIAGRDVRLAMGGAGPGAGAVGHVGYFGAFHVTVPVDAADPSKGSTHVLYCPYERAADGTASKAHVVTLDPTPGNESVSVVHADGMAVVMGDGKLTLRSRDGSAFLTLDGGDVLINGNVKVVGGLQFGGAAGVFPVALVAPGGSPLIGVPATMATGV